VVGCPYAHLTLAPLASSSSWFEVPITVLLSWKSKRTTPLTPHCKSYCFVFAKKKLSPQLNDLPNLSYHCVNCVGCLLWKLEKLKEIIEAELGIRKEQCELGFYFYSRSRVFFIESNSIRTVQDSYGKQKLAYEYLI